MVLFHLGVSPCCLTLLSHLGVSLQCLTLLSHLDVSLWCYFTLVSHLSHLDVSPCCLTLVTLVSHFGDLGVSLWCLTSVSECLLTICRQLVSILFGNQEEPLLLNNVTSSNNNVQSICADLFAIIKSRNFSTGSDLPLRKLTSVLSWRSSCRPRS